MAEENADAFSSASATLGRMRRPGGYDSAHSWRLFRSPFASSLSQPAVNGSIPFSRELLYYAFHGEVSPGLISRIR